jgi:hypothetical protein
MTSIHHNTHRGRLPVPKRRRHPTEWMAVTPAYRHVGVKVVTTVIGLHPSRHVAVAEQVAYTMHPTKGWRRARRGINVVKLARRPYLGLVIETWHPRRGA